MKAGRLALLEVASGGLEDLGPCETDRGQPALQADLFESRAERVGGRHTPIVAGQADLWL